MSTTNGTKSLKKVQKVEYLFAMALPNRKVVAERIMSSNKKNVFILYMLRLYELLWSV